MKEDRRPRRYRPRPLHHLLKMTKTAPTPREAHQLLFQVWDRKDGEDRQSDYVLEVLSWATVNSMGAWRYFRCPYHAKVIKMFESISSRIVVMLFMLPESIASFQRSLHW
jgi:hypothetical protein